jgi:hypothetical protein
MAKFKPFQMTQWLKICVISLCWLIEMPQSWSQQTFQYEYWFDDMSSDAVIMPFAASDSTIDINNLSNLPIGYHQLHLRFKPDTSVLWSSVTTQTFYHSGNTLPIHEAEYWWNQDMTGLRTLPITNFVSDTLNTHSLDISSLANGLNCLNIRFHGLSGRSSLVQQWFYKVGADSIRKIQYLECWFDDNMNQLQNVSLTALDSIETQLATNHLTIGFHQLHYRFVGSAGFSSVETHPFYKAAQSQIAIDSLIYWFDGDVSNAKGMSIRDFENDSLRLDRFAVNDLSVGEHRISIQYGGKIGWSSPQSVWFNKPESKKVEYCLYPYESYLRDSSRGWQPVVLTSPQDSFTVMPTIPCDGLYYVGVRVSEMGRWTSVYADTLRFDANKLNATIFQSTCGQDTAKIIVQTPRGPNWQYALSIPNQPLQFQTDTLFRNVPPGYHQIIAKDGSGCETHLGAMISPSSLPVTYVNKSVCDRYVWTDTTQNNSIHEVLTTSGVYPRRLPSRRYPTCDSTVELKLTVRGNTQYQNIIASICKRDSFYFENRWLKDTGTYQKVLTTHTGCDSIITLTLKRDTSIYRNHTEIALCKRDSFYFIDRWVKDTGTYQKPFPSRNGCDSIVSLRLRRDTFVARTHFDTTICEIDSIQLFGLWRRDSGIYTDTLKTWKGCDSILTYRVRIDSMKRIGLPQVWICEGQSYSFRGRRVYRTAGWMYDTLRCDTIFRQYLSITQPSNDTMTKYICMGDSMKHYIIQTNRRDTLTITQNGIHFNRFDINFCKNVYIKYVFLDALSATPTVEPRCKYSVTGQVIYQFNRPKWQSKLRWYKWGDTIPVNPSWIDNSLTINKLDTGFYRLRMIDTPGCYRRDTLRTDTLWTSFQIDTLKWQLTPTATCVGMTSGAVSLLQKGADGNLKQPNANYYQYKWDKRPFSTQDTIKRLGSNDYKVYVNRNSEVCDTLSTRVEAIGIGQRMAFGEFCPGGWVYVKVDIKGQIKTFGYKEVMVDTVHLYSSDSLGCPDKVVFHIGEKKIPSVHKITWEVKVNGKAIPISPIEPVIAKLGDTVLLEAKASTPIFSNRSWTPADLVLRNDNQEAIARPLALLDSLYRVTVKMQDTAKCWMFDEVKIRVGRGDNHIPNAFAPSEEPLYTIYPEKAVKRILKLEIYDRWGRVTYQYVPQKGANQQEIPFNPLTDGWNGKDENGIECPADIYYVVLRRELINNTMEVIRQAILLSR